MFEGSRATFQPSPMYGSQPYGGNGSASGLLLRSEADRHEFRDSVFLHGDAVEDRGDAHGFLAVGDENELSLNAHFFDQVGEAADVGFVERGVDFFGNEEGGGGAMEDAGQQGERGESFFSAGEKEHALQPLARRRCDYVDAALGTVFFVGQLHE